MAEGPYATTQVQSSGFYAGTPSGGVEMAKAITTYDRLSKAEVLLENCHGLLNAWQGIGDPSGPVPPGAGPKTLDVLATSVEDRAAALFSRLDEIRSRIGGTL